MSFYLTHFLAYFVRNLLFALEGRKRSALHCQDAMASFDNNSFLKKINQDTQMSSVMKWKICQLQIN